MSAESQPVLSDGDTFTVEMYGRQRVFRINTVAGVLRLDEISRTRPGEPEFYLLEREHMTPRRKADD